MKSAYLKQIKVLHVLSTVKNCFDSIFLLMKNMIYIFSLQQTDLFRQFRALFLLEKNAPVVSGITIRMYTRQIKQLTSYFDAR